MPDVMMTIYLLLLPQAPTCEAQLEITVNQWYQQKSMQGFKTVFYAF